MQLGGSNSGGNAENAIGFYILNRQWSNIILSLTNAGNFNISGTISEGGTQLSQKYLGINATASKATQLANSRTLWGQSFNGTQDVSGDMSGVGSLSMNGVLSGARGEVQSIVQNVNDRIGVFYCNLSLDVVDVDNVRLTVADEQRAILQTINTAVYTANHIYMFVVYNINATNSGYIKFGLSDLMSWGIEGTANVSQNTHNVAVIVRATDTRSSGYIYIDTNYGLFGDIEIGNIIALDLTAMFGAGNEPSTPEEFARRLGYASIDDVPYIPYTPTPTTLNNAVNFGGDLMIQGNKVILANGLVLNYNKSTNTLTFENTDGEPCNIVATGGVTALG